jgi:hypothetical protein
MYHHLELWDINRSIAKLCEYIVKNNFLALSGVTVVDTPACTVTVRSVELTAQHLAL